MLYKVFPWLLMIVSFQILYSIYTVYILGSFQFSGLSWHNTFWNTNKVFSELIFTDKHHDV